MSRGKSPPAPAAKPEPAGSAGRQQAAMANLEAVAGNLAAAVGNLAERRMSEGGTPVDRQGNRIEQCTLDYTDVQTMHLRFKRGRLQQQWLKRFDGYGEAMPVEHVWKDVPYE